MIKIANADLDNMAPTVAEMLEMLNVDVLPYFDYYNEEDFSFSEKYRAVAVVAETENGFAISLNDGSEIEVSKNYFQFPGSEKEATLYSLQQKLS